MKGARVGEHKISVDLTMPVYDSDPFKLSSLAR